jgi:hypothetical protein
VNKNTPKKHEYNKRLLILTDSGRYIHFVYSAKLISHELLPFILA